jgi:hypothetical protein
MNGFLLIYCKYLSETKNALELSSLENCSGFVKFLEAKVSARII